VSSAHAPWDKGCGGGAGGRGEKGEKGATWGNRMGNIRGRTKKHRNRKTKGGGGEEVHDWTKRKEGGSNAISSKHLDRVFDVSIFQGDFRDQITLRKVKVQAEFWAWGDPARRNIERREGGTKKVRSSKGRADKPAAGRKDRPSKKREEKAGKFYIKDHPGLVRKRAGPSFKQGKANLKYDHGTSMVGLGPERTGI